MLSIRRHTMFNPLLTGGVDELFNSFFAPALTRLSPDSGPQSFPPLNAWENDEAVVFEAELPGFSLDQIAVTFENRDLTIRGQRELDRGGEGGGALLRERLTGAFERSVRVNVPIDSEGITATLRDGVLTVTLPKAVAAKPRTITITNPANN
jgi:HSP20 family protein